MLSAFTSDEGDALVPGTQARAVAEQEANTTGRPVTIRNPVTDKVAGDHQTSVCREDRKGFRERLALRRGDDAMP